MTDDRPARLSAEQQRLLTALLESLTAGQQHWLAGFFAGLDHAAQARHSGAEAFTEVARAIQAPGRSLTILFGSETGNAAALAKATGEAARAAKLEPTIADMASYKLRALKDEQDILVLCSTHGEGDPPQPAKPFFEFLLGRKAPDLAGVRYAVLALGDSTYEFYCKSGRDLDARLAELGATRLEACLECDVDYDDAAAAWTSRVVTALAGDRGEGAPANQPTTFVPTVRERPAEASEAAFDKRNPFIAPVLDNIVLTGRGSTKETRHLELSLAGSGLRFQPGDALGVMPQNDPGLIDDILSTLSLSAGVPIVVKGNPTTLGAALSTDFEISAATPRFIEHWAELSGADALRALRGNDQAPARTGFLRNHHVIDIIRRFPVAGLEPQTFTAALRPLQPRLYSIASSQAAYDDEVHLTVAVVRYDLHDEPRTGVASGQFSGRAAPDALVPVYVQTNPHFRLPADETPILMIGAGTGVAPYRAFLQEREARRASGRSWLVFGERNFRTDFLYQTEWQEYLKDGVLSRMSVAFSRDRSAKAYVQQRLHEEARDVFRWLEEGAAVYICGDAARLAPDVHETLTSIIEMEGGFGREDATAYLDGLRRDHRYQVDVY